MKILSIFWFIAVFVFLALISCAELPCPKGYLAGNEDQLYPSCKNEEKLINNKTLWMLALVGSAANNQSNISMQWARLYGGAKKVYLGVDLVTDKSDNIYTTGYYFEGYDSSNSGSFVTKHDTDGNKTWDVTYTKTTANAIALDNQKNVYIVGDATSTVDGNSCYNLASRGCLFLAKYDNAGNRQWTKTFYGKNYSTKATTNGKDIAIDSSDNVYVLGYTDGYISGQSNPDDNQGVLLLKYDTSGNQQWGKLLLPENPTGESYSYASTNSILIEGNGNIYAAGFTDGHLGGQKLTGTTDTFIIKYNNNGDIQWTKLIGESGSETLGAYIALDSQNNLYVAGNYKASYYSASFMGEYCYAIVSGSKISQSSCDYIIKYDSNMNRKWVRLLASTDNIGINGMAIDKLDNIYLIGTAQYSIDNYESLDEVSGLLMKYNSNGERQWYELFSSKNTNTGGRGITISSDNSLYGTGNTGYDINQIYSNNYPTIDFYGQTFTGLRDAFIVKYK
ncbi:MAG: SBBP repeat-containing protein [Leptospiraceae bacterium]|nr:SBBP repeat-containing protein [Leptospiraceae bacterium]